MSILFAFFLLNTLNWFLVGREGVEPSTSSLSEKRSNQLSYRPPFAESIISQMQIVNNDYTIV